MLLKSIWIVLMVLCFNPSAAFVAPVTTENDITLIRDLSIGIDEVDEDYMFGGILDIALDSQENIYIFDRRNLQIRKFDSQGTFLSSLSLEKGQGPREVSQPDAMVVAPSGAITIFDMGTKKLLMFDPEGEFHKSFQLDFQATDIALYGSNQIAVLGLKGETLLHIYDREGKLLESFGQPFEVPTNLSQYKDMPFLRAPMRFDSSTGHRIFLINPHKYEISVFENGKSVGIIKGRNKSFRPVFITKSNLGGMGIVFPILHILEYKKTVYVCIRGLDREAKHQLDIFVDSKLIGSLEVAGIPRAVDALGRIYFMEEEDYPQVVRYKLGS